MKKLVSIFIVSLFILTPCVSYAQDPQMIFNDIEPKFKKSMKELKERGVNPRVQLRVFAEEKKDEKLKRKVVNLLSKELRSVPGIVLTNKDPDWILMMFVDDNRKTLDLYSVVVIVVENYDLEFLDTYLVGNELTLVQKDVLAGLFPVPDMKIVYLKYGKTDEDLKGILRDVVTDFDQDYLGSYRMSEEAVDQVWEDSKKRALEQYEQLPKKQPLV
jgi:hypothetical protein